MCSGYWVGPYQANSFCTFTGFNTRNITCINGYSWSGGQNSFPAGLSDFVTGSGPSKICDTPFNMCLYPPGAVVANGVCTSTLNTRRISCDSGYSTNGTVAGTTAFFVGSGVTSFSCTSMSSPPRVFGAKKTDFVNFLVLV